jgi:biopolymer transport protein ExbD
MKRPVAVFLIAGLAGLILLCAGGLFVGIFVGGKAVGERQRQAREARQKAYDESMAEVTLPIVRSVPIGESKVGTVTVNVRSNGVARIRSDWLPTDAEIRFALQKELQAGAQTILVRAEPSTEYKNVDHVRRLGKDAGFASIELLVSGPVGSLGKLPLTESQPDWRHPESRPDLSVLVKASRDGINDGAISALIVQRSEGETPLSSLESLKEHVKEARPKLSNKELIRIIPEGALKYDEVVNVVEACVQSGFRAVVLAAPLDAMDANSSPIGKTAVPDVAAQRKIEQEIKTIYRADYAQTKPADCIALTAKLRQAAGDCAGADATIARYVLLREAARLAAAGGDIAAALEAVDEQTKWYEVNFWAEKLQTLDKALPVRSESVADAALHLASVAFFVGENEHAESFLKLAEKAAQESKNAGLLERVNARRQEIARLKAAPPDAKPQVSKYFAARLDQGRRGPKEELLRSGGGNVRSEAAVAAGLKWLVRHQALDGHWGMHDFHLHGKCNCTEPGGDYDVAGTAFGLLPLLGAGETHKGSAAKQNYAKNVERGLKWLVTHQRVDGSLAADGYQHALATIAVCEAYGMTADPALRHPAQKAIDACVAWQHEAGGFRYKPRTPGDMSVHGWFVQVLKVGSISGLNVPDATWSGINKFLDQCATPDGAAYGYQQPQPAPTVTAVGLLSRHYMGWEPQHPGMQKGLEYLRKLPPSPNFKNVYYYYYATPFIHSMAPANAEAWEQWNQKMRDLLIDSQDQGLTPELRDRKGSWSSEGDAWGRQLGRLGYTSFALLTLEVYYRHLPLGKNE